ncbi:hypothetical protein AVEN_250375-1, partial [Araneus ventricosus]
NKSLQHGSSGQCLEMSEDKEKVLMQECSDEPRQRWEFQNYDPAKLKKS